MSAEHDSGKTMHELAHERIEFIAGLLADGMCRAEIRPLIAEWGDVAERTIRNYYHQAEAINDAEAIKNRTARRGRNRARLDYLWRKTIKGVPKMIYKRGQDPEVVYEPDLRVALSVVAEINKMEGFYAPLQIEHSEAEQRPLQEQDTAALMARSAELRGNGGARAH